MRGSRRFNSKSKFSTKALLRRSTAIKTPSRAQKHQAHHDSGIQSKEFQRSRSIASHDSRESEHTRRQIVAGDKDAPIIVDAHTCAVVVFVELRQESALPIEHLHAFVFIIAHVNVVGAVDSHAVREIELPLLFTTLSDSTNEPAMCIEYLQHRQKPGE